MAIGVIEFISMLGVIFGVDEGKRVKERHGRSWLSIAREAWGTDMARERSFLWLVGSRLFILIGASLYPVLSTFYLAQVFGMDAKQTGDTKIVLLGIVAACADHLAIIPAARLSDRMGRKKIIYGSCAIGATGLSLGAVAPILPVALIGARHVRPLRRRLPGRRLGTHERHRPEVIDRQVHGPFERGHGLGRHRLGWPWAARR